MAKKNYFLIFFFIFLSTFSLLKIFNNLVNLDTYEYGEWLINYQSGFIRRGLSGEIIFQLSKVFGNNLQLTFFIILSLICLIFYRLNYILFKNISWDYPCTPALTRGGQYAGVPWYSCVLAGWKRWA